MSENLITQPNLLHEADAICSYIGAKWTPISNLTEMTSDILVFAERGSRALFQDHPVWELATSARHSRAALLKDRHVKDLPGVQYYDAGCVFLENISSNVGAAREAAITLMGDDQAQSLMPNLLRKYPDLRVTKPIGWERLEANYNDFDGQEEFDPKPDRAAFKGAKLAGVFGDDFVIRTALPYVMYGDKCQSRTPAYALVSAIWAHFSRVIELRNTQAMLDDLNGIVAKLPQQMIFSFSSEPKTPAVKAMVSIFPAPSTKDEFEKRCAQMEAFKSAAPQEKTARIKEQEEWLDKLMTKVLTREGLQQRQLQSDQKKALLRDLLIRHTKPSDEGAVGVYVQGEEGDESLQPSDAMRG